MIFSENCSLFQPNATDFVLLNGREKAKASKRKLRRLLITGTSNLADFKLGLPVQTSTTSRVSHLNKCHHHLPKSLRLPHSVIPDSFLSV